MSRLLWAGLLGIYLGISATSSVVDALDRIPRPPTLVESTSPDGQYAFVVSSPDNWKSKHAVGELYRVTDGSKRLLWRRHLPQEFGPRFALVGQQGQVLLLDEWINVMSRYAVMILSLTNQVVAQHHFSDVQRVLKVPSAEIVKRARYGAWITSPPMLDPSRQTVTVEAGGKVLSVHLSDGHLVVEQ